MSANNNVMASAQRMISIDNFSSGSLLVLSPPLFRKIVPPTGNPTFELEHYIGANSSGGRFFLDVLENAYGEQDGYQSRTQLLSFKTESGSVDYRFELIKKGDQITYSSPENGSVYESKILYEDIGGAVYLKAGLFETDIAKVEPVAEQDHTYVLPEGRGSMEGLSISKTSRSKKKTIPDDQMFSFLNNVDVNLMGDVYQLVGGELHKVERRGLGQGMGVFGGFFALTGDKDNLYPAGISEITVEDNFSEAQAVIEFERFVEKKLVTITIKSHTSKVCDIRDLSEAGWGLFPHTVCFAL
ncbi:hypothetical protein [Pseudomonas fluorescens]|uniref:hypothetical protein n=1 Tax=Pseudomonas fluorescens TaxID=294 RepID=UPI000CA1437C|nr:hypothetical protein [Pseudomonas fluorescens]AUM72559.1 hypothetical protein C0J56_29530 [Pseudomonas fluorescens]